MESAATATEDDYVHEVFKVNAVEKLGLINKFVQITTKAGECQGFLDCADPVSQSVVLSVPVGKTYQYRLFPGSSVLDIAEKTPSPEMKPPPSSGRALELTPEQLEEKRMKIIIWLKKNLLPVSVQGDVIEVHNGQLLIYPPYERTDCVTDNSIVLARMHHLLRNVPNM